MTEDQIPAFVKAEHKFACDFHNQQIDRYIAFHLEQYRKTRADEDALRDREAMLRAELEVKSLDASQAWLSMALDEWKIDVKRFPFLNQDEA